MKKWLFLCLVLLLSGCQAAAHSSASAPKSAQKQTETTTVATETPIAESIQKTTTPTLFVHGYQGGPASFGGMLQRFAQKGWGRNEMVLTISPDGTVSTEGELSKKAVNPTIQVLFADNQNNEWNQAEWIRQALLYLKKAGIEQVNFVGHSMGGVSGFRYLTTFGELSAAGTETVDPALPKVAKFIAIGAPFNEFIDTSSQQTVADLAANGPTEISPRYQEFQGLLKQGGHQLPIELIAGQLSDEELSDGTVPTTSALAINHLLAANGYPVTEKIIKGPQAQHSHLHENQEVDEEIAAFLWEQ